MHIQARAAKGTPRWSTTTTRAPTSRSARTTTGGPVRAAGHPGESGFNLRAGSGHDIELGGEFSFWVDARKDGNGESRSTRTSTKRSPWPRTCCATPTSR